MTIPYERVRRFDRQTGRTAKQGIGLTTETPRRVHWNDAAFAIDWLEAVHVI